MYKNLFLKAFIIIIIFLVSFIIFYPISEPGVGVARWSFIRYHFNDNTLETHIVVFNDKSNEVSFTAEVTILNEELQDALGFETLPLDTNREGIKAPFHLLPGRETVFTGTYKFIKRVPTDLINENVAITIFIDNKSYTIPITSLDIKG